jgi:ABC-2 type transport system permease protein
MERGTRNSELGHGARSMTAPAGQIFDLGYQPYSGPREGRGRARWALYSTSLKAAFGIGRGGRAKIVPFLLLGAALIPAAIQLGIVAVIGDQFTPVRYDNYLEITSLLQTLFCAVVAPELLCPDRRNRTLSLYFAHAISRLDYAVMKGLALVTALLAIALGPQMLLFVGQMLAAASGLGYLRDNLDLLPRIILAAGLVSVFLGSLALAVASLTARRIFAAGGFIALMLISTATANAIWETFQTDAARPIILAALGELPFAAISWVFDVPYDPDSLAENTDLPGVVLVLATLTWSAGGMLVVAWRYLRWEP